MLYKVTVVDNDTEYKGTFEAESPEALVEKVRNTEPISNCREFTVTTILKSGNEFLCGLLNPDYDINQAINTFSDLESVSNGPSGIAIYFKEAKVPILNVLRES